MDIKHIVVATDLSEGARTSYPHASFWARYLGAKVSLLHVRKAGSATPLGDDLETAVAGEAKRFERLAGVSAEPMVSEGVVSEAVDTFVQDMDGDLVVLASYTNPIERVLKLGSTARKVIRQASVPVLFIPKGDDPEQPDHILVATDTSEASGPFVEAVKDAAEKVAKTMTVVHVNHDALDERRARDILESQATARPNLDVVSSLVWSNSPHTKLIEMAEERNASLIAVASSHKKFLDRTLLGSTTEKLCELSPVPLLIFPPQ